MDFKTGLQDYRQYCENLKEKLTDLVPWRDPNPFWRNRFKLAKTLAKGTPAIGLYTYDNDYGKASEEFLLVAGKAGTPEIPPKELAEIWCFYGNWLMISTGSKYHTLPHLTMAEVRAQSKYLKKSKVFYTQDIFKPFVASKNGFWLNGEYTILSWDSKWRPFVARF